jgi:bacteriocin resistance YdeI/OmpD-like protein/regulator of chromosome condensation (RCC1) repeat-containing protein/uncharacterized protein DUF1905
MVNGAPFRSTVAIYGGVAYLGVAKALRRAAGAEIGDEVDVEVALDDAPREVDVPPELAAVLKRDPEAARAFEGLSYTHRKDYARWIAEAKRAETRQRRIAHTRCVDLMEAVVTPKQVPRLSGIVAVAGGLYDSLALTANGRVYGWGSDAHGQLGDGTANLEARPVSTLGLAKRVDGIAAGSDHVLART